MHLLFGIVQALQREGRPQQSQAMGFVESGENNARSTPNKRELILLERSCQRKRMHACGGPRLSRKQGRCNEDIELVTDMPKAKAQGMHQNHGRNVSAGTEVGLIMRKINLSTTDFTWNERVISTHPAKVFPRRLHMALPALTGEEALAAIEPQ